LRIKGVQNLHLKTGAPDEREAHQPTAPAHARRHELRNFGEQTRNDYTATSGFTAFLGRTPDMATAEDLRRFQLHQRRTGARPPTMNGSVSALRFFFTVTLDRPNMARYLTFVREPRKLPLVLSEGEIVRLLEAAPGPKYKAAFGAAYGAGLRFRGGGTQGIRR
jgi:site-specific recombinase XerD